MQLLFVRPVRLFVDVIALHRAVLLKLFWNRRIDVDSIEQSSDGEKESGGRRARKHRSRLTNTVATSELFVL